MAETLNERDRAAEQLVATRAKFRATLGVARRELAPATLFRRTRDRAKDRATQTFQARPVATGLVGLGLMALLFRKPIAGLVRRLLRETRHVR
ncbi:MAG: hypothetical protein ACKOXK_01450 [Chakrabartia sp.]